MCYKQKRMIQVKIFEGSKEEIQEEINAFLQLSNIGCIEFKVLCETKIMLIYDLFEPKEIKRNDLVVHIGANNKLNNTSNKPNENPTN